MRQRFTKMQGAGNDFVVLDATGVPLTLSRAQVKHLGDRRFGVGADQILVVERADRPGVDFGYRIFNGASGDEVEHCGNGARCFVRFVREHGLSAKPRLRVQTVNRVLELAEQADGRVEVDMGEPDFNPAALPFDTEGLASRMESGLRWWALPLPGHPALELGVVSMGNPHAVQRVAEVDTAPVTTLGPLIETHPRFARKVNVGFVQVLARGHIRLRVWERDAGETLACGTGACAAVAVGIAGGWLDPGVEVDTHGGRLRIDWAGPGQALRMSGPAQTVYEGEIEL